METRVPEFTGQNDLRGHLRVLWRWKWLFLAFLVLVPLGAWLAERGKPNVYTARALVGVNQTTVNTSVLNGGGSFSTTNVTAIAEIVTTSPVASVAADLLHPPANASQIVGEVTATGDPQTNFLTISVVDQSPQRAAAIANAFARAISRNLQNAAISQIDSSIAGVTAQLGRTAHNSALRVQLQQQLGQLRAARSTQGSEAAILQRARPPGAPSGPHLHRTVELALLLGLLLGLGAVALAENADRRLRTPPDLERLTDLPVVGAIAPSAFSAKLHTTPEDEEAFHMLRTSLTYFNASRRMRSIVITSAGEKEGKTTVATRLALNAASAGQRVILVDADLRRAQVAARLSLDPQVGLAEVLAGHQDLDSALVTYPTQGVGSGQLQILPAGPPPPNPSALISSDEMQRVLKELERRADLVIIDTPAALAVSDPLPLMRIASGVVLVARMNRSVQATIARLQQMVKAAGGSLVGVVATGVKSGPGYDYHTPKHYTHNGTNGKHKNGRRAQEGEPDAQQVGSSGE
jgi:capsular exopolysaccharide synthesis family protein